jgi:serine/threonine protein kinase
MILTVESAETAVVEKRSFASVRTRLGHYRVIRRLGAGGMGEVYLAEDTRLKRQVALKLLPERLAADPVLRARLKREAEAVAALDHPNIVTIHSFETADGDDGVVHFFTMQAIDGRPLSELIPSGGFELERFDALARPLADAVGSAHERGIVHRDLKPANVMVGRDERLRVLDFGLAKLTVAPSAVAGGATVTAGLTGEGVAVGTVPYMAPEQLRGEPIDARADVFSLGCIFYELLVGERPFRGDTQADVVSAILRDRPDPVSRSKPGVPVAIDQLIGRCLEKDPAKRYATATELRRDLDRLEIETTAAIRSPSTGSFSLSLPRRPSLAILPFTNLAADPEQADLAFGLWADLNSELVKVSGLFLISQTSTGLYQGRAVDRVQAARELGVRYILEGSVRRSGSRVRVTVQLSDTETGETRWAERYDRALGDLFELQDEIVAEIVAALDVTLVHGEAHRVVQQSLRDPRARDAYYKALAGLFSFRREGLIEARRLLTEVESIEPDSPIAHVFTAFSHYFEAKLGYSASPVESLRSAMESADRAIAMEESTGTAYMIKGLIHINQREHDEAVQASEMALRARPSCPWAWAIKGAVSNYTGQPAAAIELARRAIRHSPLAPPLFAALLATSHYLCGHYEEAAVAARGTIEVEPENLEARLILAGALFATGDSDEAHVALEELRRLAPDFDVDEFVASQPYLDPGVLGGLVADLRSAGLD